IKTETEISKDIIKEVMKEARLMRGLDHPNVVKLYGVGVLDRPLYILLEYVAAPIQIVEFLEHFSGLVGDHKELAEPPTPEEQKSKSKIVPMRKSATSAKHSAFAKMRKKNKNYEAPRKTEISQDESYSK
ncbi:hypothetical protein ANCCEY_15148, partial [Ancylostoma ceylanicum]